MITYQICVEYLGTNFVGWQLQKNGLSIQEVLEIKHLGETLTEGLCARGKNYIAARKRAGEKSSAYHSGRGVKVCKGKIK